MSQAIQALYTGDVERARRLLPNDEELSVFEAAAFGRVGRLRELLGDDPARADARAADGFRPLHLAIFGGQTEAVQLLVERGADVDAVSSGSIAQVPPLGTAAFVRSTTLARVLLEAGADPNVPGEGGFTALHTAAANGDRGLVRLLLEHGADAGAAAADGRRPGDLAADDETRALLE